MKRILCAICIGSLALIFAARGEQTNGMSKRKAGHKAPAAQNASARTTNKAINHGGQARVQRNVSTAPRHQRTYNASPRAHSNSVVHQNNLRNDRINTSHERNVSHSNRVQTRNGLTINRQRNFTGNRERNVTVNNNWRGERFNGQQYAAFRNYRRESHNRNWWRSQNDRIIFVGGGWYSWNAAGFWFPAWGYAPGYNYPYDGPIYGYNNLAPDRVVVNVQEQLRHDGYYAGSSDGVLGPMTRQAIGSFQADHGLAVTSAVDEPTLAALGLV